MIKTRLKKLVNDINRKKTVTDLFKNTEKTRETCEGQLPFANYAANAAKDKY